MDFSLLYRLRKKSSWMDIAFHFFSVLLISVILFYLIFVLKTYLQNKKIDQIDKAIAAFGTEEQKRYEKEILEYRKKIDDFALIIKNHKIPSNVFSFLEKKTLPNVWFLNFDMSESTKDIKMSGETENMESLSRQVKIFEENKDYVKSINVLSSNLDNTGRVIFILALSLEPKVFEYTESSLK